MNQAAQNQFNGLVQQLQASVLVQAGARVSTESLMSGRASQAVGTLGVTPRAARVPGFFKPEEAAQIMAYASGRGKDLPAAFTTVASRAAVLDTIQAGGIQPGGRMQIKFAVESGADPLDEPGRAKMVTVSRILNRSVNDYREAFKAYADAPTNLNESEAIRMTLAEENVIRDTEMYLLARNDLAGAGFDVSSFDKNAETNSLLVLAVHRHDLDKGRDFEASAKPAAPSSGMGM